MALSTHPRALAELRSIAKGSGIMTSLSREQLIECVRMAYLHGYRAGNCTQHEWSEWLYVLKAVYDVPQALIDEATREE